MIIYFVTVHPWVDVRVRFKKITTLALARMAIFVQHGTGTEAAAGGGQVVRDAGAPERGRLQRMALGAFRMYRAVRYARINAAEDHAHA